MRPSNGTALRTQEEVRKHDRVVRTSGWGPGGWIWIAAMVLFWAGLLAATVYLIRRRPAPAATGGAGTGPAETALAELYARGEIDADEYRRLQAVLREQHDQGPGS